MGYIYDIISELNKMDIAMEADDITDQIDKDVKNITGKNDFNRDQSSSEDKSNDGEIDTNTDDILGTNTNDNDDDKNTDSQDGDTNNDTDTQDDEDTSNNNYENDITDEELDETMQEEENPFETSRKKKIHKQFLTFYNTICSNIKIISEFMPEVVNEESLKILNNVKNRLTQCKEYTYIILTEEYNLLEYPALLKKYVALNRVYDICIKILETYYEKYDIKNDMKKKSRSNPH